MKKAVKGMKTMRIGLVLDESLDPEDGVQQYVMRVGKWMSNHGHEVFYLVGETHERNLPNLHSLSHNVKVSFNGNRLSVPLPTSRKKLRRLLRELQLDILHIQTPYSPFMAGRLMKLASPETAVLGTFHILPYGLLARLGSRALNLLTMRSSRCFDAVMAVSEPAAAFAKNYFGLSTTVVPNAFDYDVFYRKSSRFAQNVQRFFKPAKIVFLGRLVERKGAMQLLEAVHYMNEKKLYTGKYEVVIGGKGPLLAELKRYAQDKKLDMVSFAGFVADADKVDFLAGADLAVFPSLSGESFGISLLEALAAARGPVIGGDNPGYASVMQGFNEQLVNPKDTEKFAKLLAAHLHDPKRRSEIADAQKAYVKQFDVDIVCKDIEQVYKKTVEKRRAA
jgi:phosphatidylinositol alpha-mannosyltransferase